MKILKEQRKLLKIKIAYQGRNNWKLTPVATLSGDKVNMGSKMLRADDEKLALCLRRMQAKDTATDPASERNKKYMDMVLDAKNNVDNEIWIWNTEWESTNKIINYESKEIKNVRNINERWDIRNTPSKILPFLNQEDIKNIYKIIIDEAIGRNGFLQPFIFDNYLITKDKKEIIEEYKSFYRNFKEFFNNYLIPEIFSNKNFWELFYKRALSKFKRSRIQSVDVLKALNMYSESKEIKTMKIKVTKKDINVFEITSNGKKESYTKDSAGMTIILKEMYGVTDNTTYLMDTLSNIPMESSITFGMDDEFMGIGSKPEMYSDYDEMGYDYEEEDDEIEYYDDTDIVDYNDDEIIYYDDEMINDYVEDNYENPELAYYDDDETILIDKCNKTNEYNNSGMMYSRESKELVMDKKIKESRNIDNPEDALILLNKGKTLIGTMINSDNFWKLRKLGNKYSYDIIDSMNNRVIKSETFNLNELPINLIMAKTKYVDIAESKNKTKDSITEKQYGYDVYLNNKHIDTVYYDSPNAEDEVKQGLIDYDNYDPRIVVVQESKKNIKEGKTYSDEDIQKFSDEISKMTDKNYHAEAFLEIAKFFDLKILFEKLELINKLHDIEGSLNPSLSKYRGTVIDSMLGILKRQVLTPNQFDILYSSL